MRNIDLDTLIKMFLTYLGTIGLAVTGISLFATFHDSNIVVAWMTLVMFTLGAAVLQLEMVRKTPRSSTKNA